MKDENAKKKNLQIYEFVQQKHSSINKNPI